MKKNSKLLLILLCLILAFSFAACGGDEEEPVSEPNEAEEEVNNEQDPTIEDYSVKIYYANMEYIEVGDESLGSMVGPFDTVLEDIEIGRQYYALIEAMRDVGDAENAYTMLTPQVKIDEAYLDGDTLIVDFSSYSNDGAPLDGSALEEMLLVEQIVKTMTESFSEVAKVQFLVDGEKAETLMGHIGIDQPFTRSDADSLDSRVSEEAEEDA